MDKFKKLQMFAGLEKMKKGIVEDFEILFLYILYLFAIFTEIEILKMIAAGSICIFIFVAANKISKEIKIYMECKDIYTQIKGDTNDER